jgi:hypothetical protein
VERQPENSRRGSLREETAGSLAGGRRASADLLKNLEHQVRNADPKQQNNHDTWENNSRFTFGVIFKVGPKS